MAGEVNWVDAMIEREAIPLAARQETVAEFCAKWNIDESTYYRNSRKDENQKKSLKIALSLVKKKAPEILEKLAEKASAGDMKATDMFLNYVLELSKNLDLKSDGKEIKGITAINYITPNGTDNQTNSETTSSLPGSE